MPATQWPWQADEIRSLRSKILGETTERDGALFWNSNGAPVPVHCFQDAGLVPPAGQTAVEQRYLNETLAAYRRGQARRRLSAEEAWEARQELGPGAIDIITGRRIS